MRGERNGKTGRRVCKCTVCSRVYEYNYRKGHTKLICNSCRSNGRVDRVALKRKMVEYKGGSCQSCGYSAVLRALTFHHIDPATKEFDFGGGCRHRRWELVRGELDKTVLLCVRCHFEVEAGARTLGREVVQEVLAAIRNPSAARSASWKTDAPRRVVARMHAKHRYVKLAPGAPHEVGW